MKAKQSIERLGSEIHKMVSALASGSAPPPLAQTNPVNDAGLLRAASALRANVKSVPKEVIERLIAFVRDGEDIDLARIRPFEIADAWGVDRLVVLDAMLEGVRAGLLEMRWEIVCPSCQQAASAVPSLDQLSTHTTCQLCDIAVGLELDEAIEATFTPGGGVRDSDSDRPFCIGGPSRVPHVVSQAILPSQGEASLAVPEEKGRYRLFARGGFTATVDVKEGASESVTIAALANGDGGTLEVRPGGVVRVTDALGVERHVKLERSGYSGLAATARIVTAMPKFRRDFSSDILRPGTTLQVSKVTLFFSDLTASTQLYSTVGDAAAFRLVHDHFEVVMRLIEQHNGALVKTIGDAVMAVFARELDAVAAGMAILEAFETFRAAHPHRQMTHIKLGLYGGPCYAVTANNLLDYFGQTVNIAARLQAQAESGELVIDEELSAHAVREGLLPSGWLGARYEAKLKGVDAVMNVVRVRLPPGEAR
jgi:adenylate cyclase